MQLQTSDSPWLDESDDSASPQIADVLSGLEEERPHAPAEPGQAETDDALGAYLREIGRGTLLTKEQEIELAKQIKANSAIPWHPGAVKYFTEKGVKM